MPCILKPTKLPSADIPPTLCAIWERQLDKSIENKHTWDHVLVYMREHCGFPHCEVVMDFMVPSPPSPSSSQLPE